ncbi:hypothetical protein DL93DRAFT_310885 [Clavulina sp. PMI_390]|nr:hypothetical protein DL93DRAFT_310885 [Clavulina sp. PMI_390]
MATKSGPSKKAQRSKSKSRPVGTTALSEPLIAEASSAASFTAFSPSGLLFAHVALAVDKHRLRIFDTESGKAVAETVFQNSRVSAIHWTQQSSGGGATPGEGESIESANNDDARRKRAKRKSVSGATVEHVLAIGFMNGTVAIFSPRQGEITKTFSSSTISSSILSITSPLSASDSSSVSSLPASLWTSSSNGQVCAWDLQSGKLLTTLRTKNAASQYTAIAVRSSGTTPSSSHLLAAHHRIQLFGAFQSAEPSSSSPEYASFTGHASPVFALQWASSPVSPHSSSSSPQQKLSFISAAEGDRFACIWQVPDIEDDEDYDSDDEEAAPEGVLAASIPLDTDVRAVAYSSSSAGGQFALALSASGALRIFVPPTVPNVSSKGKGVEPVTSVAGTTVSSIPSSPPIVSAAFDPQSAGMVRVARLVNGVRPVFERVVRFILHHYLGNLRC